MTALVERLTGRPAEVAEAVGAALARLHAGSGADAGSDTGRVVELGPDRLLVLVAERAADGLLQPKDLPHPYRRYSVDELVGLAVEGAKTVSERAQADPVPVHGDPRLEHLVVDDEDGARVASDIVGSGLGDRHLDLAIAHQSVHHHLGAEAVMALYRGYGREPDLVVLDYYILMSFLLGRSDLAGTSDR